MTNGSDSFVFKTDRPWPNKRLKVAAIVGHTTSNSSRLWLRTGGLGAFSLLIYHHDANSSVLPELGRVPLPSSDLESMLDVVQRRDFEIVDYENDTTHVVDVEDLSPNTRYGYLLLDLDGQRVMLGHNRVRGFRTPPKENSQEPFQLAFFSCNMPYAVNGLFKKRTEVSNIEMWDFLGTTLTRHADSVDLVIAGGDQCYSDGVKTLNLWSHLNRIMRIEGDQLLPDEEAMRSWYRDVYRGYWGFDTIQQVFDSFPTYMIWDDHEIGDGWGSHYYSQDHAQDGLSQLLPDLEERGLSYDDGMELLGRMFNAAKSTYIEYQHSHNPPTAEENLDYAFERGGCGFYVLDGRGHRDLSRDSYRILGKAQFDRFAAWLRTCNPDETPFLFVVSAVPMLHTRAALVAGDERLGSLGDDLRDSWEHELHDEERAAMMDLLFDAAARGMKVSILSGDVHVSAVFEIEDESGNRIHQLTSSAITYGLSLPQSWVLRLGAADEGKTAEGHDYKRLALYTQSSFAMVSVEPKTQEAWFKLYGAQQLPDAESEGEAIPISHSLAKIRLV